MVLLYDPDDDIVAVLRETGELRRAPNRYRAQATRLVNDIKASGCLIPELVSAWRAKGVSAEVSSSWQSVLFASFGKTRVSLGPGWKFIC